ncbi:MAG: lipid A biosynthesis acyltransferase [Planctomycetes bacterium]|jgi:KDO2-lipid IV(A) lauroyltransferase|nr:lipid A biosynthesis acyltransferase [Planctomycetota bacterium]
MTESQDSTKKKKKKHPIRDWLAYVAVRILVIFLCLFDVETNLRLACFLGDLLWKYYKRGRLRALENLRASFSEQSEAWIEQTGRRSFQHLVMLVMDVLLTPRLVSRHNWRRYSRFVKAEYPKWMMKEGKGLIMVTAHYGNFEIIGYLMGLFGFDIYSVARPLDNKYLNRFLYAVRQRHGLKLVDKKGAAEQMPAIIKQGSTIGFIADQDAGRKGIFVDFFGRKASTYKSIGLLAITYHLPIIVGCARRVGSRFFFEFVLGRIIFPHEWADKDDPLTWVTAEYSRAIEAFVREDPTQYWWVHRRWKTRPKEERQAAGAQTQGCSQGIGPGVQVITVAPTGGNAAL